MLQRFRRAPALPLANVLHGGVRSFTAVAGVCFSLVMVFLQLGFLRAVSITAVNLHEQLDFDIALISPEYRDLYESGGFPESRLRLAQSAQGVTNVTPLWFSMNPWLCPPSDPADYQDWLSAARRALGLAQPSPLQRRELLVIGVDLDRQPFRSPIADRIAEKKNLLRLEGNLLMNERSSEEFGYRQRESWTQWESGAVAVNIVGSFPLLRGFGADASILCGVHNFRRFCSHAPDDVNIGLLKTDGANMDRVLDQLRNILPDDVKPIARTAFFEQEEDHWVRNTVTGKIFSIGVMVAMTVAAVVIYQVLSNDIRQHYAEYATLKAIGYTNRQLTGLALRQGFLYALFAFPPAVAIAKIAYAVTETLAGIPMLLAWENVVMVLGLSLLASAVSATLTLRRLWAANPADLF